MPPSLTIAAGGEERAFLGGSPGERLPVFAPGEFLARTFFYLYFSKCKKKTKLASGLYYSAREMATTEPNLGR